MKAEPWKIREPFNAYWNQVEFIKPAESSLPLKGNGFLPIHSPKRHPEAERNSQTQRQLSSDFHKRSDVHISKLRQSFTHAFPFSSLAFPFWLGFCYAWSDASGSPTLKATQSRQLHLWLSFLKWKTGMNIISKYLRRSKGWWNFRATNIIEKQVNTWGQEQS